MSINRDASQIVEHTASFITFDQTNTWGQIGDATPEQTSFGYNSPNVQAAIDDLYTFTRLAPGTIILTVSATSPGDEPTIAYSQNATITVSGAPTAAGTLDIDSHSVAFTASDTPATIASKIAAVLVADTVAIHTATASGVTVTYEYNDQNNHPTTNSTTNGVKLVTVINTIGGDDIGYIGYGSWQLLGSETKYSKTIYTWLRVA